MVPETPSLRSWNVKMHDYVEVNKGEEEGMRGRVIDRHWKRNEVTVEGVNMSKKEVLDLEKGTPFSPVFKPEGIPLPLYFRDVSLIDPQLDRRVDEVRWEQRDGVFTRISVESGTEIPVPGKPEPLPKEYADAMCTRGSDVLEVTYTPLPDHSTTRARAQLAAAEDEVSAVSDGAAAVTPTAAPGTT